MITFRESLKSGRLYMSTRSKSWGNMSAADQVGVKSDTFQPARRTKGGIRG
jgi:hypothetical protein